MTTAVVSPNAAQKRFNETYITSAEICRELRVTRPSIMQARKRGLLPEPIAVNGSAIYIWERAAIAENLSAWRIILTARRSAHA